MSIINLDLNTEDYERLNQISGIDIWGFNKERKSFSAPFENIALAMGYYDRAVPSTFDELLPLVLEEDRKQFETMFLHTIGSIQGAIRLKTYDDRIAWIGVNGVSHDKKSATGIAYLIDHATIVDSTLKSIAHIDPLTNLGNRRKLYDIGSQEIERAKRYEHKLSLMILDIDGFKEINTRYGHTTGDKIIQSVGESIDVIIRQVDIKTRVNSDVFVILLLETDRYETYAIAERLRKTIEVKKYPIADSITISCGIAEMKFNDDIESLFNRADLALLTAKKAGNNTTRLSNL